LAVSEDDEDVLAELLLLTAGRIAGEGGRDGEDRVVDLGELGRKRSQYG
jgi:hypothetical protein